MFKVGDRVICINNDRLYYNSGEYFLNYNTTYIITEISLDSVKIGNINYDYYASRFKLDNSYYRKKN